MRKSYVPQVHGTLRISISELRQARRAAGREPKLAGLAISEVVWRLRRRRYQRNWYRRVNVGAEPRAWHEYTVVELRRAERMLSKGKTLKSVARCLGRSCPSGLRRALEREGYAQAWLKLRRRRRRP